MSTQLRRIVHEPDTEAIVSVTNRLLDIAMGNKPGRFDLYDDDGLIRDIQGGATLSSTNPTLRLRSGINLPLVIRNAADAADVMRVTDATTTLTSALVANGAVTLGDAAGDVITVLGTATFTPLATFTGGLTATGTVTANGALVANGAVTLGDAAADVITVTGTATFAEIVTLAKGLVVDTTSLVVDAVNNKVGVGAVPVSTDAMFSVAGVISSTAATGPPTTNANQVFLFNNTGTGVLRAQNPSTATWLPLQVDGLSVDLQASGVSTIKVDATGLGFYGHSTAAQPAAGAAATDLASVITLANSLRTGLRGSGLFS